MGRSRFAASARACFASLLSRLFRPRLLPATSRIYACEPLEPVRLAGFGIWFGGIYQIE